MLLTILFSLTSVATSAPVDIPLFATHLYGENLVDYLNYRQDFFKAERCNYSQEEMESRVMKGLFLQQRPEGPIGEEMTWIKEDDIPASFDSRTQWPSCSTIKLIYNQGQCGSCWAFCSAESMSDRTCIATTKVAEISADDILSCCSACGFGCGGGWPINAFNYWNQTGVVTGGGYGSGRGCKPYEISPSGSSASTPTCKKSCEASYSTPYQDDKHYGFGKGYYLTNNVTTIQKEIMAHGPISAIFDVYGDFYQYSSGVYHHAGAYYGSHCVKVIGWGVSNGTPYWLVANSWGRSWGESGFFRIRRGTNECGFESQMATALPRA